jgi:dTDP-4-amino-4,6-dideoxygalactose transaminase
MVFKFALDGVTPQFSKPLPVGQLYFPSWERYEEKMRGIFERDYYINNGPLLNELEFKLQVFLGVKHVVCVTNATFGLMMAIDALGITGKIVVPSFTFIASAQSILRTGLTPVFCDVNPLTHQLDLEKIDSLLDENVSAIMGVNLWGGSCEPAVLEKYASERGLSLYFDSAHAFGCEAAGKSIGGFGDLEVFSFHATKILSATEGGCICTNSDELAARLRGTRPSYGNTGSVISMPRVANARMSEAQAAIALMSLEDFPMNQLNNLVLYNTYKRLLDPIPGLKLVEPAGVTKSNYQYLVCEIDSDAFGLTRDQLTTVLKAENINARRYFYPGTHRSVEFKNLEPISGWNLPVTDRLCGSCIQLPIGALVSVDAVEKICNVIANAQYYSEKLRAQLCEVEL